MSGCAFCCIGTKAIQLLWKLITKMRLIVRSKRSSQQNLKKLISMQKVPFGQRQYIVLILLVSGRCIAAAQTALFHTDIEHIIYVERNENLNGPPRVSFERVTRQIN